MESPYRVKALLSGDMSRANFRCDVAALQEQLGECASADGPQFHGADHAPLVLFGERAAYFSIVGDQRAARAAGARVQPSDLDLDVRAFRREGRSRSAGLP